MRDRRMTGAFQARRGSARRQRRVVLGWFFFPRGGSAQVARASRTCSPRPAGGGETGEGPTDAPILGDDYEAAVVPPEARRVLTSFDERTLHYNVAIGPDIATLEGADGS